LRACFRFSLLLLVVLCLTRPGAASGRRPFDAESADLLREGEVEVEAGITAAADSRRDLFPAQEGSDLRLPVLGLRTGLGSWAEIRVEGDAYRRFDPDEGDTADGAGDWRVGTKVRLGRNGPRHTWAAWLGVKIPVASDDDGLGTNETDVDARLLYRLHAGRGTFDFNGGIALLGAPYRERSQVDLVTYAAAYRHPVGDDLELGVEIAGREGGDFFHARSALRTGFRWQRQRWRLDGALAAGLADGSPDLELRLGATFRFQRGPLGP
jgi:hypothetical protein